MQNNYLYFLEDKPYLNLTNKCTNSCVFCVRDIKDDVVGANLWLGGKTAPQDAISQFDDNAKARVEKAGEITFCGYGEPLLEADALIEVAKYIRAEFPNVKIRINTNGHAKLALKRDILPELVGLIDVISVSLNAQDEETYNKVSKPNLNGAYNAVLDFVSQCVELGFETVASVVVGFDDNIFIDTVKCEEIVKSLGAKFRIRQWIKEGY